MQLRRALVSVALVALVAAGCGGGGDSGGVATDREPDRDADVVVRTPDEAFAALNAASDATSEAGTARFSMTIAATGAEPVTVTMDGGMDFTTGAGVFEMDLGAMGLPGGGTIEARLVGGSIYLDFSAFAGQDGLAPDVQWVELDLERLAGELGFDVGDLGGSDPSQVFGALESLRGVSDDIELVGPDEVRGVPTEHYRVEVDLQRALAEVPEELRDEVDDAFAALGDGTLPMDVWIDAQGRLRRLVFELSGADFGAGLDGAVTMTMDYFDFGVELDVQAPPPEATVDFMDLFGRAMAQV